MSEAELKPCPFCGSDDVRWVDGGDDDLAIYCMSCKMCGGYYEPTQKALGVAAWNRRAHPSPADTREAVLQVADPVWDESRMHQGFPAIAETSVGTYVIWEIDTGRSVTSYWKHESMGAGKKAGQGLDAAKLAVKADILSRVRAALASPKP